MTFIFYRTVRFQDTDAAGVVYFANVLAMCHEAYEACLAASSVDLKLFFGGTELAMPIVHASVDFFKPMHCGDRLQIHLTTHLLQTTEFALKYQIFSANGTTKLLSQAMTRHVCIDGATRSRRPLPDFVLKALTSCQVEETVTSSPGGD